MCAQSPCVESTQAPQRHAVLVYNDLDSSSQPDPQTPIERSGRKDSPAALGGAEDLNLTEANGAERDRRRRYIHATNYEVPVAHNNPSRRSLRLISCFFVVPDSPAANEGERQTLDHTVPNIKQDVLDVVPRPLLLRCLTFPSLSSSPVPHSRTSRHPEDSRDGLTPLSTKS